MVEPTSSCDSKIQYSAESIAEMGRGKTAIETYENRATAALPKRNEEGAKIASLPSEIDSWWSSRAKLY
jgi:hypothetical protein